MYQKYDIHVLRLEVNEPCRSKKLFPCDGVVHDFEGADVCENRGICMDLGYELISQGTISCRGCGEHHPIWAHTVSN